MPGNPKHNGEQVVVVDFEFKRELALKIEGNLANYCYQCGACVGDCPAAAYTENFNPREIMLEVLYGLSEDLLGDDSTLWLCTNCYNCHERCPQDVKPVEVIISLKNMLADRGYLPPGVDRIIKTFEETGRTVMYSPSIDRRRAQFGLEPLGKIPTDELKALLKPDCSDAEEQEGGAA